MKTSSKNLDVPLGSHNSAPNSALEPVDIWGRTQAENDELDRRNKQDLEPWVLTNETVYQWIARQPELWDVGSEQAAAQAVTLRDAMFRGKCSSDSGVYFLMGDPGGFYYVGKATNIRERVINHFQRGKDFSHCWWIEMPVRAAELVEAYLITINNYPMNRIPSRHVSSDQVKKLSDEIERWLLENPLPPDDYNNAIPSFP